MTSLVQKFGRIVNLAVKGINPLTFIEKDQIFTTPWKKFVPKSEREENDVHVIALSLKDIKTMFM